MSKQRITIAGGGSTYTPGIVQAILNKKDEFALKSLCLYDISQERLENMKEILSWMFTKQKIDNIEFKITTDPKEAFTDVDFVFTQIRVGGLSMREQDEKAPLKYNLVGQETCGVGGFAYGLRTIGPILELVGHVIKYSPNAWILNYTNPETIVAEAIRRVYPNAKMVNACDMTISIETTLSQNYGYDRKNWIQEYYGLNHFGWYQSIYDKSLKREILPELLEKLKTQDLKEPKHHQGDQFWRDAYGMMNVITRNFPEHIPNNYLAYYLYPDVVAKKTDRDYTRANSVMDGREKEIKETAKRIKETGQNGDLDHDFGAHGEYIVDIASSILNDSKRRYMLIVPNAGAIANLRSDAVVEVPCYVGATGVESISIKNDIPDFHKGLMEAQVASEKLLVDAYFENSYHKALQAFTLNQSVPSAYVAKKILDDFIEINKDYWPELK